MNVDFSELESALKEMRESMVKQRPAGGWLTAGQDYAAVSLPFCELEVAAVQELATTEVTLTETVRGRSRSEASKIAGQLVSALNHRAFLRDELRIIDHSLVSGPRFGERLTGGFAELTWRVRVGWRN